MAGELIGLLATDEEYEMYWEPGEGGEVLNAVQDIARLIAKLQAEQVRLLARFVRLRPGRPGKDFSEFAPDELSAAMRWTRSHALAMLRGAVVLTDHVPEVLDALDAGRLDEYQATVLADAVHELPAETAHQVSEYVLARAAGRNVSELRRIIRRAVLRFGPERAEERRVRAREQRRVDFTPYEDGMASLWALLPANEAFTIHRRLDAFAAQAVPGDPRTHDQRRADALVDLMLDPGLGEIAVNVDVTIPATTLDGTCELPANLPGYGPITPTQARELAAGTYGHRDPVGTFGHADSTRPGGHGDPAGTDGDRRSTRSAGTGSAGTGSAGTRSAGTRCAGIRSTGSGSAIARSADTRSADTRSAGTRPATANAGRSRQHIAGRCQDPLGSRLLADARWRRFVTRPRTGELLEATPGSYRPARLVAEFVRARDQYCVFPGCSWPARSCDIDHRVPYPQGDTSAGNLNCLCRHHHRLKHEGNWQLQARGRSYVWINPDGIEYVKEPEPLAEPEPEVTGADPVEEPPPF